MPRTRIQSFKRDLPYRVHLYNYPGGVGDSTVLSGHRRHRDVLNKGRFLYNKTTVCREEPKLYEYGRSCRYALEAAAIRSVRCPLVMQTGYTKANNV